MTRTSGNAPGHQRVVIVTAILAAVIGGFTGTPTILTQFWIALAPIAFFGLAHGGADPWLLRRLTRGRRRTTLLWFAAYITLAACFVGVIVWQPTVALILFLLLSIWHFGRSDAPFQGFRRGSPAIWLAGSIPIIGPMFGQPVQTGQLFAWLLDYAPGPVITTVEFLGPVLMAIWAIGVAVFGVIGAADRHPAGIVELLAVATAMILLPPIIAFTFYFCVVHSTRHFMELLANPQPPD
ncbi:MAG: Brp/Blh family beta-carotene 15,15'-dioxygenase, partial [Halofilum sp. (in: g-proteobacteria)]